MMLDKLKEIIPVEGIQERDIDLLLLEELKSNPDFIKWFLNKTIAYENQFQTIGAWHSLSQAGLGETDVALLVQLNNKKVLFLIENKITANFQPEQESRYRKRGRLRMEKGECDEYHTVLTAPKQYIDHDHDFDFHLDYESIRDWFEQQLLLGERAKFKSELLNIAIERLRRGYRGVADDNATDFWWKYYEYSKKHFSHLEMRKPKNGVPKLSNFIPFEATVPNLKKGDEILHKAFYGNVDIQLRGKADEIEAIKEIYQNNLPDDAKIIKAGKSVCIRCKVPKLDFDQDFENQISIVRQALEQVDRLYNWANESLKNY
ncbi:hypothetical protein Murru_1767 [Allomuricauda ruestringensis DSM 13258]|uniref:Uncharacterized protein n=2 Tax=Flagellimonas TaxID=444459 RepID=G2PJ08_ALLRU|nr:hypothetical protein Murru_1767 [Allomuricauda ruestringensis DSM 13258]